MKKLKSFLLLFIFVLFCEFFICSFSFVADASNVSSEQDLANNTPDTNSSIPDITTYSPACILMDAKTGKVLYEKNSSDVRFPASTTKIMTAILTLENCKLSDVATVSHNAVFSVPAGYTHASLKEGEELSIENLLNVLLIPSANDAANVLAEHISGSVEEFANLMNEKAKEIGCLNTHFVNPNGVHNKEHVSTAYDLALMGRYAMQNPTFREIVKKTTYTLPATNKYDKTDRSFVTTNDLLRENHSSAKDNYYYPYTIGIKTGYTSDAGSCIVAGASKDNMEMIVVILGGESTSDGLSQRYLDCKTLFNYAFENYSSKVLHEENSVLKQIKVKGATKDTRNLNVLVKDQISILCKNDDVNELTPEIIINDDLKAPISVNSVIGKITYNVDGETYSSDLIAGSSVIASGIMSLLIRIVLILVTLYLIFMLIKTPKRKPNYKKKRAKKKTSKIKRNNSSNSNISTNNKNNRNSTNSNANEINNNSSLISNNNNGNVNNINNNSNINSNIISNNSIGKNNNNDINNNTNTSSSIRKSKSSKKHKGKHSRRAFSFYKFK